MARGKKVVKPVASVEETPVAETAKPNGNGKRNGRKSRDTENPPFYVVLGETKDTGSLVIVWRFRTIGQARKGWANVMQGFGTIYSNLRLARVKSIPRVE